MYENISRSFFDAMNSRDFNSVKDDIHNDICFDFPGSELLEGQRRVLLFLTAILRKYKRLTFEIMDVVTDGNKVCVIWNNSGKTDDNKDYRNSGATYLKFEDDKIVFLSDYFKDTSFTKN